MKLSSLLLLSVLFSAPGVYAAGPAAPAFSHPIVGTWTWTTFGGSCNETYQYRVNRTLLSTSGQEVSEKTYDIAAAPDAQGFYKLVETVVRQNDKKDCSGAMLEGPGEKNTRYIQFSPLKDKLLVCESASLKACFGPLARLP